MDAHSTALIYRTCSTQELEGMMIVINQDLLVVQARMPEDWKDVMFALRRTLSCRSVTREERELFKQYDTLIRAILEVEFEIARRRQRAHHQAQILIAAAMSGQGDVRDQAQAMITAVINGQYGNNGETHIGAAQRRG